MEAAIFVGLQGAGKTTFYRERFFRTHLRINMDMLKTRHREDILLRAFCDAKQPFVVDNTNATAMERARYISLARQYGFRIIGYYFRSKASECLERNASRPADERVRDIGVLGTAGRLEL